MNLGHFLPFIVFSVYCSFRLWGQHIRNRAQEDELYAQCTRLLDHGYNTLHTDDNGLLYISHPRIAGANIWIHGKQAERICARLRAAGYELSNK